MNQVPNASYANGSYGNPNWNKPRAPRPAERATQRRHAQEDQAWSDLYRSIKDPAAAAEVVEHLESDEQTLRQHTALYLRSRETLRRERARVARNQRIGQVIRSALAALASLFASARRAARNGGDVALEVLAPERCEPIEVAQPPKTPQTRVEPAVKRARKLAKQQDFAPMSGAGDGVVGSGVAGASGGNGAVTSGKPAESAMAEPVRHSGQTKVA